ncbi:hypothetical protein EJB05_09062, partial [Eragrostis curvula]
LVTSAASVGAPIGIYDATPAAVAWGGEAFRTDAVVNAQPMSTVAFPNMDVPRAESKLEIQAHEDAPAEEAAPSSDSFGHDDARPNDKVRDRWSPIGKEVALRRLAQNREAARKSRLQKKKQELTWESSRMKLAQMEQDLTRVRRQPGVFVSGRTGESAMGLPPPVADPRQSTLIQVSLLIHHTCLDSLALAEIAVMIPYELVDISIGNSELFFPCFCSVSFRPPHRRRRVRAYHRKALPRLCVPVPLGRCLIESPTTIMKLKKNDELLIPFADFLLQVDAEGSLQTSLTYPCQ